MKLRKVEVQLTKRKQLSDDTGRRLWKFIEPTYANGYFHCWEHYEEGKDKGISAIVELEDGTVKSFEVGEIKFLDKPTDN
ncbi:hypothetical protein [Flavobacterium soli]|uniref:hypothetical protein n=1 Tax=Flavobacterium soli TaxID=344881 RepID=UPI0003F51A70|nr:hypothetical protein [Flavobacterium soli]